MKVAWERQVVPRVWCRAGGVFIPKERDATSISQFRPISLLNGKIFFSIIAQRLSTYLLKNGFIDTSVHKAGTPGFSGCLANAYGSVPHELLWAAFDFFQSTNVYNKVSESLFWRFAI